MNRDQYLSKRQRLYGESFANSAPGWHARGRDGAPESYRARQEHLARLARADGMFEPAGNRHADGNVLHVRDCHEQVV